MGRAKSDIKRHKHTQFGQAEDGHISVLQWGGGIMKESTCSAGKSFRQSGCDADI